jgi:predicted N-acetyltransferase YhbS
MVWKVLTDYENILIKCWVLKYFHASTILGNTMHLHYLTDYPDLVREVAELQYTEFGPLEEGESIEERAEKLTACCLYTAIPTAFVAMSNGILCGSALLVGQDLELRQSLSPWLAGVYVKPQFRERGIGSALVTRVEEEAKVLAVPTLYLYTPHSESFYARLGWQVVERCEYRETVVTVMAKQL